MGTKTDPGFFNCYGEAAADEPLFTLLARDPDAPLVVEIWARVREARTGPTDRTREALDVAMRMRQWRLRNVAAPEQTCQTFPPPADTIEQRSASRVPTLLQRVLARLDTSTRIAIEALNAATTFAELIEARGRAVGRDGGITIAASRAELEKMQGHERHEFGEHLNESKERIEALFSARRLILEPQRPQARIVAGGGDGPIRAHEPADPNRPKIKPPAPTSLLGIVRNMPGVPSISEARRLIATQNVTVDGGLETKPEALINFDCTIRIGKHRAADVVFGG